jgi:hypothetical protein
VPISVPSTYGIYEELATCNVTIGTYSIQLYQTGSFKVEQPIEVNITNITDYLDSINYTVTEINTTVNQINGTTNYIWHLFDKLEDLRPILR